jgi:3-hydroxybutyryl-CoA dehydrogenase
MIRTICICGAGTMGAGIAQVAAMSGFRTLLYDLDPETLQKAGTVLEKNLQFGFEKNKISLEAKKATMDLLHFVNDIRDCVADLVIEAIVEKWDAKVELFNRLAEYNNEDTILATNTSSLSVLAIAKKINRPERFAGMHFFNPAPVMKLVEVVYTDYTSEDTIRSLLELAKQMGKTPVICRDAPGFIVNHVARPYYLEALFLLEQGICDMESLDKLLEASGFRMGPFKLMDLIGNDINYQVSCSIYEAMNKPERLRPSPIQMRKVEKGELGRKTGRGYYDYHK